MAGYIFYVIMVKQNKLIYNITSPLFFFFLEYTNVMRQEKKDISIYIY